jgi:transcriptional regulator with XRE-family HTH domain
MEKSAFTHEYGLFLALLREVRQRQGLTQVELAERLGETQSFVSKCERGERRLDVAQLRVFCQALGVPLVKFVAEFEQRLAVRKPRRR